jgi:hypothetical protein
LVAKVLKEPVGGQPPKGQTRTFVFVSVGLLLACWIIIPLLVGISIVT